MFVTVYCIVGPPGVYSPDVAGLYMGDQHMMRPPGKIKAFCVNYSIDAFFASYLSSQVCIDSTAWKETFMLKP